MGLIVLVEMGMYMHVNVMSWAWLLAAVLNPLPPFNIKAKAKLKQFLALPKSLFPNTRCFFFFTTLYPLPLPQFTWTAHQNLRQLLLSPPKLKPATTSLWRPISPYLALSYWFILSPSHAPCCLHFSLFNMHTYNV